MLSTALANLYGVRRFLVDRLFGFLCLRQKSYYAILVCEISLAVRNQPGVVFISWSRVRKSDRKIKDNWNEDRSIVRWLSNEREVSICYGMGEMNTFSLK